MHLVEQQGAADGAAHAQRVPVAGDAQARGIGRHRQVHRILQRGAGPVQRAQHAVGVGRPRQRREDLLAADEVAVVDPGRDGAPGRLARGGRATFGKGLRVDLALPDDALVVDRAVALVVLPLLARHVERIGDHAAPQARRHVHVEAQRRRAAMPAHLGRDHHIGAEVGAVATVAAGHADAEQPGLAQVGVVVEREARLAIVLRGTGREAFAPEFGHLGDQAALLHGEQRLVAGDVHGRLAHVDGRSMKWLRRKATTAALNRSGASMFAR